MSLDDGLTFSGYIQPPSVPPDPIDDGWRGPQGIPGPPGPIGPPGPGQLPAYSMAESLATGDGTTDDRPAIQTFLDALALAHVGAEVILPPGKWYAILSAPLTIPANIVIRGAYGAQNNQLVSGNGFFSGGGFLVNPALAYGIRLNASSGLRSCKVYRTGMVAAASSGVAASAYTAWAADAAYKQCSAGVSSGATVIPIANTSGISVGMPVTAGGGANLGQGGLTLTVASIVTNTSVTLTSPGVAAALPIRTWFRFGGSIGVVIGYGCSGAVVDGVQIVGFRTGIQASGTQYWISNCRGDCTTNIEAVAGGDTASVSNCEYVPLYGTVTQSRPGASIFVHDGEVSTNWYGCSTTGWLIGWHVYNAQGPEFVNCAAETLNLIAETASRNWLIEYGTDCSLFGCRAQSGAVGFHLNGATLYHLYNCRSSGYQSVDLAANVAHFFVENVAGGDAYGSIINPATSGGYPDKIPYSFGSGAIASCDLINPVVQDITRTAGATTEPFIQGVVPNTTGPRLSQGLTFLTPGDGATIVCLPYWNGLVIGHAVTAATMTITLPPFPADKQSFPIYFNSTVTTLTVNTSDGATVGKFTSPGDGVLQEWVFIQSQNTWYCGGAAASTGVVDLTSPGPIGSVTPNSGSFLTLGSTGSHTWLNTDTSSVGVSSIYASNTVSGTLGNTGGNSSFAFRTVSTSLDSTGNTNNGWWSTWFSTSLGAVKGGMGGVKVSMTQTSATGDTAGTFFWNPHNVYLDLEYSGAGTGAAFGNGIATANEVFMGAGATGWGLIETAEDALIITPGATVAKAFIRNYIWKAGAHATSGIEAAEAFGAVAGSTVGLNALWAIGTGNSQFIIDPAGWVLTTHPQTTNNPGNTQRLPMAAAGGFDFWRVNFSDSALRSSGVTIDNGASVSIGAGNLYQDSTGLAVDVSGYIGAIASIASPGLGYQVGDQFYDAIGGIGIVDTLGVSGTVTAAHYLAGKEPYSFGANPSPMATTGGSGNGGLVVNVGYTRTSILRLNPSGTTIAPTFFTAEVGMQVGTTAGANAFQQITSAAGGNRSFNFMTGAVNRWSITANNTAESGSDAGTNLIIQSRNDAGAATFTPVGITRATGDIRLGPGSNTSIGSGAQIATSATTGFLLIPSMNGTPTGAVGSAGNAALVINDATNTMWFKSATVWTQLAPLASPTFTGTPAAPTAAGGTNTTQLATTAFVTAAVAGAGVASFNTRTGAVTLATGDLTALAAYAGSFTTLAASGAVSGAGITALFASPPALGGTAPAAGAFTTASATGQITSTLATGTAPLVIASTTNVANLNASSLGGATFAAPGSIGSGTPAAGAFTTLSASGAVTGTGFATFALLASPTFTGTPAAPTAAVSTNTTQIATTAFVLANRRNKSKLPAQWVSGAIVANTTIWFEDMPYGGTINSLRYHTGNGSFTVAVKINGTDVTSLSAVAVSSATPASTNSTAAFTFVAGDTVTFVITAATGSPTDAYLSADVTWS